MARETPAEARLTSIRTQWMIRAHTAFRRPVGVFMVRPPTGRLATVTGAATVAFALVIGGGIASAATENPALSAPGLEQIQYAESTPDSVTLHWTDRSTGETGFKILR